MKNNMFTETNAEHEEYVEFGLVAIEYEKRLSQVLSESWKIFKSQFVNNRNTITNEAQFQHHFAQIIRSLGDLYSLKRNDLFKIDLEVLYEEESVKRSKYIDITCGFFKNSFDEKTQNCAIELKFKTQSQGAIPLGRIQAYKDLETLEKVTKEKYDMGKFYMITDSKLYPNPADTDTKDEFTMRNGHKTVKEELKVPEWKNIRRITKENIILNNSYNFEWEKINKDGKDWYFLELTVNKVKSV